MKGLVVVAEEIGSLVASSIANNIPASTASTLEGPRADAAKKVGKSTLVAIGTCLQ